MGFNGKVEGALLNKDAHRMNSETKSNGKEREEKI